jgi:hypothetical protein
MTTVLKLWFSTIAATFANVGALFIFAIIYAFLLVAAYIFISIQEATIWQVLVTYALMVLIPIGFFILQASIVNRALDQKFRWRVVLIDTVKFLAVSIPVLLVVWLLYYLLSKLSARYPAPIVEVPPVKPPVPLTAPTPLPTPLPTPPLHWPSLTFVTLRFLLLGVVFPLTAIHLWIAVAGGGFRTLFRDGVKSLFQRIALAVARAFSPDSVFVYGLGLIIFFVLPYVALVPVFKLNGNKTEFVFFVLRLLLSFLFSLIGWVITLSALARTVSVLPPEVSAPALAQPTEAAA